LLRDGKLYQIIFSHSCICREGAVVVSIWPAPLTGFPKQLADTKRVELEILPIDKPAPVWARRSDLKKLIVVLLDNAIKFTPEDGRIEVRIAHFADQTFLEVQDTGVGIAELS
jgi:signal transduction histidine kinase